MSQFIGQNLDGTYPVGYVGPRGTLTGGINNVGNAVNNYGAGSGYRGGGLLGNFNLPANMQGSGNTGGSGSTPSSSTGGGGIDWGQLGSNLLNTGLGYYNQQEEVGRAQDLSNLALRTGQQAGLDAAGMAEFKPYTVTSGLATGTTTPEGGLDIQLSPEEQARQGQYLGQAQGLFGGVGQDVAAGSQALYEQIRAAQRPEEERERMRMQEGLLSQGRQGIRTAAYGGTPEQLAFEQARQEAMLNAQLAARTQFGKEQDRTLQQAEGLMTAGYNPQRQAIDLFGAANAPASYADAARRQQGSLYGQSALSGLEGMLQAQQLANDLRATRDQNIQTALIGPGSIGGQVTDSLFDLGAEVVGGLWDEYGIGGDYWNNTSTIGGTQMTSGGNRGSSQAGSYTGGGTGLPRGGDADGDGVMNIHDSAPFDPTKS